MTNANSAATRLTTDSAASEKSPTEPVRAHASVFSAIVARRGDREPQQPRERCANRGAHSNGYERAFAGPLGRARELGREPEEGRDRRRGLGAAHDGDLT